MDSVHVLHEAFYEVTDAQADGPVGVTLQPDHLVGTETVKITGLYPQDCNSYRSDMRRDEDIDTKHNTAQLEI